LLATALISVSILLCLPVTAVAGAYAYYQYSSRIAPGVHAGEIELGGMTVPEAALTLSKNWSLEARILATNGSQSQLLTPAELGFSIDALEAARQAHQVGRSGSLVAQAAQIIAAAREGHEIEPQFQLDPAAAQARLEALAPSMTQPAKDASLRLEGAVLVAVPAELGYTINISETLSNLTSDPQAVLYSATLPVVPLPLLPRFTDVAPAMAEAQKLLDTPVQVDAYDPVLDEHLALPVPREAVATWLKIEQGEQGLSITLDEALVQAYLSAMTADLRPDRYLEPLGDSGSLAESVRQRSSIPAIVRHHPTTYMVQPGDTLLKLGWRLGMPYWMILQANPGLNPDALLAGSQLVIPSKDDLLPLPVVLGKRIVISISRQRLWAYQDGGLLHDYRISTGIDRSPTQPGVFQVRTHEKTAYASVWDLYMPNFLGVYEAWPGFMNGIHGLPTLSNGQRLWANILGRPASYGCIILDLEAAKWLYQWAEDGVVVEIRE
jgi:LysM repeat protein